MKTVKGDLIQLAENGIFDLIIHGCNCFCNMGAGIARQIKHKYPQAYQADLTTKSGDREKLGQFTIAKAKSGTHEFMILNAYTQYHFAGDGPLVDYNALQNAFEAISTRFTNVRIGYPKIGAGLAGGDWDRISRIIDLALNGMHHMLVEHLQNDL